ncbi:phosphatidylglycerophosphatase A family protein [Aliiruegeria sabulilitoris]|uniref:phosphatidylglycerophosphatase A family protein n=1 Tax=Aliiruegeria sabulilitoris TaxID=1510458 RepID=UPI00082E519D|nr:phosphatidylglycerophosphatase A [Aliiruegeria sabulilitoris]NDR58290.1 phosphatidylglycerophosphatase A [Pseudoruegeria sp. M32A2M]
MMGAKLIATFLGVGLLKPAPGTWGSAAAIPFAYLLHLNGGFPALAIGTLIAFIAGWGATALYIEGAGNTDPSEVVIDEVVGMWIALWPLSFGLWHAGLDGDIFPYPGWVGGFVMFRIFDIWKPWPVSWADGMHSSLGVMLDDVIAGVMAALVVAVAAFISHSFLMG